MRWRVGRKLQRARPKGFRRGLGGDSMVRKKEVVIKQHGLFSDQNGIHEQTMKENG